MFRVQQLLVSWIVSSVADIADVKPTDIQGALLLGHANISNLRLRLHRINDAIPVSAGVECTGAQLDSLVVVAEWFSLSAKPIRIEATGVRLTFAARDPNKALGNIVGESDREARKLVLLQLQNCDTGVQADGENKAGDLKEDSDGDHQSSTDEDFASCVSDSFSSREVDGAAAVTPAAEAVKPSSMWSWFTSTVSSIVPPPVTSRKVHITVRDVSCDLLCGDAALRFLIDSVEISFDLSDPSKPRDCQVHGVRVELLRRSSGVTLQRFDRARKRGAHRRLGARARGVRCSGGSPSTRVEHAEHPRRAHPRTAMARPSAQQASIVPGTMVFHAGAPAPGSFRARSPPAADAQATARNHGR
jgi:hypothetical protein